jgi:hypothetical protein
MQQRTKNENQVAGVKEMRIATSFCCCFYIQSAAVCSFKIEEFRNIFKDNLYLAGTDPIYNLPVSYSFHLHRSPALFSNLDKFL